MNKQQLASRIWASANNMRSKIEANEYKDYILGFIFYKFLSEREEEMLKKEHWSDEEFVELIDDGYDPSTIDSATKASLSDEEKEHLETIEHCQKRLGYFISYENLFSTWLRKGKDFDLLQVIRDWEWQSIKGIEREKEYTYTVSSWEETRWP